MPSNSSTALEGILERPEDELREADLNFRYDAASIADIIRGRIDKGEYEPKQRLFRLRLAEEFNVSAKNLTRTFKILREEGKITRGHYVYVAIDSNSSEESAYTLKERVAATIRQRIIDGTYKPGDLVPRADLAVELNVSDSTVYHSFKSLHREGRLSKDRTHGFYVTGKKPKTMINVAADELIERIKSRAYIDVLPPHAELQSDLEVGYVSLNKVIRILEQQNLVHRIGDTIYIGKTGERNYFREKFKQLYPDGVPSRSRFAREHGAFYRRSLRHGLLDDLAPADPENVELGRRLTALRVYNKK